MSTTVLLQWHSRLARRTYMSVSTKKCEGREFEPPLEQVVLPTPKFDYITYMHRWSFRWSFFLNAFSRHTESYTNCSSLHKWEDCWLSSFTLTNSNYCFIDIRKWPLCQVKADIVSPNLTFLPVAFFGFAAQFHDMSDHNLPGWHRYRQRLASVGVEPTTFALLARRSNRLS